MPKRVTKKTPNKFWQIALVCTALVLVTGAVVAKKLMVTKNADIFMINSAPVPTASPVATSCVSQITSFTVASACATQGFKSITYTCAKGKTYRLSDGKTCYDLTRVYQEALTNCGMSCTQPRPSTTPTPTPTPRPTVTPIPVATKKPLPSQAPRVTAVPRPF